jgi:hypothetical protein
MEPRNSWLSGVFVKVDVVLREGVITCPDGSERPIMAALKGAPLAVLIAIGMHVGKEGTCWPGIRELCRLTGYRRWAVKHAIKALEAMNLLQVTRRRGHASIYATGGLFTYGARKQG